MAERALNSGGHLSGFTTGLDSLNAKIGGLHKSDLIIVAGRPGMGKSSLGTNIAFAAAQRFLQDTEDGIEPAKSAGAPVALFSLEMSADQLATRILAEQSGISSENLRMGKISQQEFRDLARAAAELQSLPLYIDDTPGLTIAALRTRARRLKRQKGIGLIVVDYLQLLPGHRAKRQRQSRPGNLRDQPRPEAARQGARRAGDRRCRSSAARSSSARTSGRSCPTCANRARSSRTPTSCSSSTARIITSRRRARDRCRRPSESFAEYGRRKWTRVYGRAEVIVAKQRHGSTGKVRLKFDSRITKFSDPVDEGYLPEMRS